MHMLVDWLDVDGLRTLYAQRRSSPLPLLGSSVQHAKYAVYNQLSSLQVAVPELQRRAQLQDNHRSTGKAQQMKHEMLPCKLM